MSRRAVDPEAAVALATRAFRALGREPGMGRAEAVRRAMVALQEHPEKPCFAHPLFRAPFFVVGEGR